MIKLLYVSQLIIFPATVIFLNQRQNFNDINHNQSFALKRLNYFRDND